MRFILVECHGPHPIEGVDALAKYLGVTQYRASCWGDDKKVDLFFYAKGTAEAKDHVRKRYPDATFGDEGE